MVALLHNLAQGGDEGVVALAVIVFVVFIIIIVVNASNSQSDAARRVGNFASSLHGYAIPGGAFELPSIRFQIAGLNAVMAFAEGKYAKTSVQVRVPMFTEGRLSILSNDSGRMFSGFFGPEYKGVGESRFDANYIVTSEPESLKGRVFSTDRLGQVIGTIRRLNCSMGFSLKVESGLLTVQVAECLTTWSQVQQLEATAAEFLGYLRSMPEPGIQWGERAEQLTGLCPICTTVLREPLVRCERCRSPHHKECWDYLGRCATYGCDPRPSRRAA